LSDRLSPLFPADDELAGSLLVLVGEEVSAGVTGNVGLGEETDGDEALNFASISSYPTYKA